MPWGVGSTNVSRPVKLTRFYKLLQPYLQIITSLDYKCLQAYKLYFKYNLITINNLQNNVYTSSY